MTIMEMSVDSCVNGIDTSVPLEARFPLMTSVASESAVAAVSNKESVAQAVVASYSSIEGENAGTSSPDDKVKFPRSALELGRGGERTDDKILRPDVEDRVSPRLPGL